MKERNYLVGLDGRILPTRSEHAALSSLLQAFEACAMKCANWITYQKLLEAGLVQGKDFAQVGWFHDELQFSCGAKHADFIGKTIVSSIEQAGIQLGSTCPLTGEYCVGPDWSSTH